MTKGNKWSALKEKSQTLVVYHAEGRFEEVGVLTVGPRSNGGRNFRVAPESFGLEPEPRFRVRVELQKKIGIIGGSRKHFYDPNLVGFRDGMPRTTQFNLKQLGFPMRVEALASFQVQM